MQSPPSPIKFSQFPLVSTLDSGSYLVGYESGSDCIQITADDLAGFVSGSMWVSAPVHSTDPGSKGYFSSDATYLYVYVNGAWRRIALGALF